MRERNLNKGAVVTVELLLEFSKWTQVLSLLLFLIDIVEEIYHLQSYSKWIQNRNRVTSITIQHWTTTGLSRDHHTDRKTAIYVLPHAKRRNIVGQQLLTLLDATCCLRLQTLLHVVPCCCIRLHITANTDATTLNIVGPTMLGVIASVCTPLPTRTQQPPTFLVQQCWELLRPFARSLSRKQSDNYCQ